jgi:hypothetical protein
LCLCCQVDDKAVQTPFEQNRVVRLSFSKADAPEKIVFVLKELQPENWINNGSCYSVQVRALRTVDDSSSMMSCGVGCGVRQEQDQSLESILKEELQLAAVAAVGNGVVGISIAKTVSTVPHKQQQASWNAKSVALSFTAAASFMDAWHWLTA